MGLIGPLSTAAAVRSIVSSQVPRRQQWHQLGLVVLLLLIFGTELVGGIVLLANAASSTAVQFISFAMVSSLIVGIARAWELVGDRDTGLMASLAVLTRHRSAPVSTPVPASAASPEPGDDVTAARPGSTRQASEDGD